MHYSTTLTNAVIPIAGEPEDQFNMQSVTNTAEKLGTDAEYALPYGRHKAKIALDALPSAPGGKGKKAKRHRRRYIGIDRSARYAALARARVASVAMSRMEM